MNKTQIGFSNSSKSPRIVCVEPWGEDYTLLPGDSLLILAFSDDVMPWFQIGEGDNYVQVWCNETDDFQVTQNGQPIQCGHNRQPGSSEDSIVPPPKTE